MPVDQLSMIPFLIEFQRPDIENLVIFFISVLAAVTVNAESQAMMATTLGDIQKNSKERFHFNPFLHMDIPGILCFAVAGFGWARPVSVEPRRFKHPRCYLILTRFAGPFANLLLAGIAGSIVSLMQNLGVEDQVFKKLLSVNLMVFVFNFLPIPPLAGASLFSSFRVKGKKTWVSISAQTIPYLLVIILIFIRISHAKILDATLYPIVRDLFFFITR